MGSFTSFDYTLLVTDELVDEILALGDKVEITFRKIENEVSSKDWAYQKQVCNMSYNNSNFILGI